MKKYIATAAASASLLGGAVLAPALVGSASAQEDDDTSEVETAPDEQFVQRANERLEEVLAPLVEDGTITDDQKDAVISTLADARPERRFDHGHRAHHRIDALVETTGIDAETWQDGFEDGKSLSEIAEQNGLSEQDLIDLLLDDVEERLDEAVAADELTAEEADERLEQASERITTRVTEGRPGFGGRPGPGGGFGPSSADED